MRYNRDTLYPMSNEILKIFHRELTALRQVPLPYYYENCINHRHCLLSLLNSKVGFPMGIKVIITQGIVQTKSSFHGEYPEVQLLQTKSSYYKLPEWFRNRLGRSCYLFKEQNICIIRNVAS